MATTQLFKKDGATKLYPVIEEASAIASNTANVKLMMPKVFPLTATLTGGGLYKKGTSQSVTVAFDLTRDGVSIIKDATLKINTVAVTADELTAKKKVYADVTASTTYQCSFAYSGYDNIYKSVYATFVNPRYNGIVSTDTPTEDQVTALTESLSQSAQFTVSNVTLKAQRYCYAYPAAFGNPNPGSGKEAGQLGSIKDQNGLDASDSFSVSELTLNGEKYWVYILKNTPDDSGFGWTFNR